MASTSLRYVPLGPSSLSSDAPGWSVEGKDEQKDTNGPACWKCKGSCILPLRKKQKIQLARDEEARSQSQDPAARDAASNQRTCPVCKGKGHLPIRSKFLQSQKENSSGVITSRRRRPNGWKEFGHVPPPVQAATSLPSSDDPQCDNKNNGGENTDASNGMVHHALALLSRANGRDDDYVTRRKDIPVAVSSSEKNAPKQPPQQHPQHSPRWLPSNPGEQLCNLVGRWRILQRVASHRWTTDDLVTAYVAASTFVSSRKGIDAEGGRKTIRYLDLGTGNASVLQMASWYLLSHLQNSQCGGLEAVGVEARSEAVGLARRSLSFNLGAVEHEGKVYAGGMDTEADAVGPMDNDVRIVQGDFRDLVSLSSTNEGGSSSSLVAEEGKGENFQSMENVASKRYDLITGTPPYFRVDFTSADKGDDAKKTTADKVITSAVIRQGGMPTSIQSAPARCEFRGGIEAYCQTASVMLSPPHGLFVVCENWLNNDRVWNGAKEAGLTIDCVWPVMGKVGKGDNLFAVYVMKKKIVSQPRDVSKDGDETSGIVRPPLVVRDGHGKWTKDYAELMDGMSIPVVE